MFFYIVNVIRPIVNASEVPNGVSSQVRFRHFTDMCGTGNLKSEWYSDNADYFHDHESDTLVYNGAWCPQETGNYRMKLNGRGHIWLNWEDSQLKRCESDGGVSGSLKECTTDTFYVKKGRCYPFWFQECSEAIWRDANFRISFQYNGGSYVIASDFVREYSKDICLKWYYGTNCDRCTVDCNGNGYCGGVLASSNSPDKCICTANTADTFCEPANKVHSVGKNPGFRMRKYETKGSTNYTDSTVTTLSHTFQSAYEYVELTGNLYLPQNSAYRLRVISKPGAQIEVNGKTYGSFQGYNCEEEEITVETDDFSGDHILVPLTIKYGTGCAAHDQEIKVQWQFKRWYTDKGIPIEWSDIPSKYLFSI